MTERTYAPADTPQDGKRPRKPYEKPRFERVELAVEETLSSGCKLGSDSGCVGPPITAFEGGS